MTANVLPRLRQVVIAAWDLEATTEALRQVLGVPEGFHDRGVAEFGLVNEVLVVGNTFLEVVTPTTPGPATAAGRFLTKTGDRGGYMAIFQVEDHPAARARIADAGMRTVWRGDLPQISGTHVHPADLGGAIVSLDTPAASEGIDAWHWAGPDWVVRRATDRVSAVVGVEVAADEPAAMCARWATVIGADADLSDDRRPAIPLADGSRVEFRATEAGEREGIVGYVLRAVDDALVGTSVTIGGTHLAFVA